MTGEEEAKKTLRREDGEIKGDKVKGRERKRLIQHRHFSQFL